MLFIDLLFLITIIGFGMFGYMFGFFHTLGSLCGTLLGAFLAGRYYLGFAGWLTKITGWEEKTTQVVAFITLFIIANRFVGFLFWILDKVTAIITSLPFLKTVNRLLGLFLGLFEGAITLGLILYFIDKVPLSPQFMRMLAQSEYAPKLVAMAGVLMPLLPEALKRLETTIDYSANLFQSGS